MVSTLLSAILQEFNHFQLQKLPHFMSSSQLWLPGCSKSAALWAYQKPKLSEMNNKTKNSCYFTVYWVVYFLPKLRSDSESILGITREHYGSRKSTLMQKWCCSHSYAPSIPKVFSPHLFSSPPPCISSSLLEKVCQVKDHGVGSHVGRTTRRRKGTEHQQVQLNEVQQWGARKQAASVHTGGQAMACLSPRKLVKGRK